MHRLTHTSTFSFPGITRLDGHNLKRLLRKIPANANGLYTFCFQDVRSITNMAADIISSSHTSSIFELPTLESVDKKTAKKLAVGTNSLLLGCLNPGADILYILSEQKGALEWSGMKNINKEQAEAISLYKGNVLEFSSLQSLTADCAEALSKYRGEYLCFTGIKKWPTSVRKIMTHYKGALQTGKKWRESLSD